MIDLPQLLWESKEENVHNRIIRCQSPLVIVYYYHNSDLPCKENSAMFYQMWCVGEIPFVLKTKISESVQFI